MSKGRLWAIGLILLVTLFAYAKWHNLQVSKRTASDYAKVDSCVPSSAQIRSQYNAQQDPNDVIIIAAVTNAIEACIGGYGWNCNVSTGDCEHDGHSMDAGVDATRAVGQALRPS